LAELLKAGADGVESGRRNAPRPKIMIHINHGDDKKETKHFLDKLTSYAVPFDLIGLSYDPFWQGTLNDLRNNLYFMASTTRTSSWRKSRIAGGPTSTKPGRPLFTRVPKARSYFWVR
jgi:arabinogalactan endo-1,4-beta-galactosidase